jgi:hypothetical protein
MSAIQQWQKNFWLATNFMSVYNYLLLYIQLFLHLEQNGVVLCVFILICIARLGADTVDNISIICDFFCKTLLFSRVVAGCKE